MSVPGSLRSLLAQSPWACELAPADRERAVRELQVREVPANGLVCAKGAPVTACFGVIDGLVKIASVSSDGKAVTFTGVPAGGWFGEGSLLKDEPRRYDGVALRDSLIAVMPRATFQWLLDTSLPFNRFLIRQLNERLAQFIALVEFERMLLPDARAARCLAQLFNPVLYPPREPRLDISQAEVGYLTGLSRQRANQALQALEGAGLLKVEYGGITVLDLEGLRRFGD